MMHSLPQRGFTLLVAVILASVSLSLGLVLLDIAYKQIVLASSAKQSQAAFYNADAAMECALYWDQQHNSFGYDATSATLSCNESAGITASFNQSANPRTRTFTLPCPAGAGTAGQVTITKAADASTYIFATGYNTCDAENPRRIERGLKVTY